MTKKLLAIFTVTLLMLINITSTVIAADASSPFEVEGTIVVEFDSADDFLKYYRSKGWVNESWYSDDYYDYKINQIWFMKTFTFIPKEYRKEDIKKLWMDDVKIVAILNDGSKISGKFRNSVDEHCVTPQEFYYCKSSDSEISKLKLDDVQNVIYDPDEIINYNGVYLILNGLEELQDYIENKKWNDELWYHPARENEFITYMKKYLSTYLFIPTKYTKDDIYSIVFSDKTIGISFNNHDYFSYNYSIFDNAASVSAPTFLITATLFSIDSEISESNTEVYNVMADNSTVRVVDPIESNSNDSE